MKKGLLLVIWLICDLIWSIFLIGGTAYLVFYKGISGLWFILTLILTQSSLYEEIKKYKELS